MKAVGPYLGAILILFGALMTYAGAKFLFYAICVVVAGVVTGFSFLLIFNLFIPVSASTTVVGLLLVLCFVLGGVVSFFTYHITTKAAVPVLAGLCGLFAFRALYG